MGNKNSSSPQDGHISDDLRHNTSGSAQPEREIVTYEKLAERRSIPKSQNTFYKIMLTLNILAWIGLVIALILFHYARPEFISGLQVYWGIEGDESWSQEHTTAMVYMLWICLGLTLISLFMRVKRTRRQKDRFGVNLIVLLVIVAISLVALLMTLARSVDL